jgi:calcineurin-like phosphoesterase family protein
MDLTDEHRCPEKGGLMKVNSKLWLISDTHFGHDNIVKYQQRPKNHEITMLDNWLLRVKVDDFILHMGDVAMGGPSRQKGWLRVLNAMPGRKFLLLGNHDNHYNAESWYQTIGGFTVIPEFVNAGVAFTHIPISKGDDRDFEPWGINIHGHTHGNDHHEKDGEMYENKEYINVCVEKTSLGPVQVGNVLSNWKWDS